MKNSLHGHSRGYATLKPFKLADIGEGIAEVELLQWFIKEGDMIEEFDSICEVQSDKATVEIKSPFNGRVKKLYYELSDMAKVGSVLCDIEIEGDVKQVENEPITPQTPKYLINENEEVTNEIHVKGKIIKVLATPAVRYLAKQNNINLADIIGTGKDKRVTKGDILKYIEGKTSSPISPKVSSIPVYTPGESRVEKLKGFPKAMAKKMEESLSIPHFGYCEEVVLNSLIELRQKLKPIAESQGVKLSYMPFIIKACSLALKKHPILNSSIDKELTEITYHASHNIGVAVDTPTGLVVPNIKNVQNLTVIQIAEELQRLAQLAKENKLPPQDLTGGTFTISNIGTIGGTYAKPVLVVPEVCIGAIGRLQKVPRFDENDNVVPTNIIQFSWSADHRVVDGATMAHFSNKVKQYLETPGSMILDSM